MPRPPKRVKSFGAIDLHFHGAFGIDLMTAKPAELDSLSAELAKKGVAGFSATTLSASETDLAAAVTRLGAWIRSKSAPGAVPLGIHLEGPFSTATPPALTPPESFGNSRMTEIEKLWKASRETLQILTIAPETLDAETMRQLTAWAAKYKVRLAIGHTRCTQAQAVSALDAGFSGRDARLECAELPSPRARGAWCCARSKTDLRGTHSRRNPRPSDFHRLDARPPSERDVFRQRCCAGGLYGTVPTFTASGISNADFKTARAVSRTDASPGAASCCPSPLVNGSRRKAYASTWRRRSSFEIISNGFTASPSKPSS